MNLAVSIPFLLRAHVSLYTDYNSYDGTYDRLLVVGTDYAWISDTQIQLLASAFNITVKRKTPTTGLLVGWTDGSNVDMDDLLTADRQNLYAVQEQEDSSVQQIANSGAILDQLDDVLPYAPVGTVATIPTAPTNGQRIEIGNSTGIESFSPLTGRPSGFVGASTLTVRLVYTTTGDTWQWVDYRAVAPDSRYANINFTQSGTGAVSRSVTSKLAERVSVKDFGATGNGTTDDSAAIQAAINATLPRGTIYFPEGIYIINSRINVDGVGTQAVLELIGEGSKGGASELRAGSGIANQPMFKFADSDIGIRNLFFNGNGVANSTAVDFLNVQSSIFYIKDCTFTSWTNGIYIRTPTYRIQDCYAISCTNFIVGANWAVNGVIFQNYTQGCRRSVWLRKDYTAGSGQIQQAEGVQIIYNGFGAGIDNAIGIDIEAGLEILIQGNVIDQNRLNGIGINLQPAQAGDAVAYVKILDNWIDGGTGSLGACIIGNGTLAGTGVERVWIERNTFVGWSGTLNKPSVYLNSVSTYWLLNNALLVPTTVKSFSISQCTEGNQLGNTTRITGDSSITRNSLHYNISFKADRATGLNATWEANVGDDVNFHFCGLRYNNSASDLGIVKPYGYSFYLEHGGNLGASGGLTIGTANANAGPLNFIVGGSQILDVSLDGKLGLKSAVGGKISILTYNGGPEGNVTANPGSLCLRTDSGQLYVKQGTGTGNTGWVVK